MQFILEIMKEFLCPILRAKANSQMVDWTVEFHSNLPLNLLDFEFSRAFVLFGFDSDPDRKRNVIFEIFLMFDFFRSNKQLKERMKS